MPKFADLPAATDGVTQGTPRDVLVDRIVTWINDDDNGGVYDYADRLIRDLDKAGFAICTKEEYRQIFGVA